MSGLRKECKIAMKMSFSGKVKEELASQLSPARHCQIAEFAALFALCGKIRHRKNSSIYLEVHTENLTVARKSYILIKMAFQAETQIRIRNHSLQTRTPVYHLLVLAQDKAYEILKAIKLLSESEDRWGDLSTIPSRLVQNTCCKRAYLRGVFMAAGSITNRRRRIISNCSVIRVVLFAIAADRGFLSNRGEDCRSKEISCLICKRRFYDRGHLKCYGGTSGIDGF